MTHTCNGQQGKWPNLGDCDLLNAAYILAGLAMMLNIRLSYSSAPYALIRFKLPENLFSVFVRRMASALELWCLPSMLLGNIVDLLQKLVEGGHQVRALKYNKIRNNDIQGNQKKGDDLNSKAGKLMSKAQALHDAAGKITGVGSGVEVLTSLAGALKNAAKKGSDDLYNAAQELESADSAGLDNLANKVIEKFEAVKTAYTTLMTQANEDQKKNPKVTAVEDAYKDLETIYDQVLNLTKLAYYAEKLKEAANASLTDLKDEAEQLEQKVKDLRNTGGDAHAQNVKDNYETVVTEFNKLETGKKGSVKTQFQALKGAYEHIGLCYKDVKFWSIIVPSIVCQWLNFLTYVLLLIVYVMGGDQGHLTTFYFVIAISGVVFGINMTLVYSVDFYYVPVYIVGENSFPILTSFIHYISTLIFGNRRKWNSDFIIVNIDIWMAIIISFVAAAVWTYAYLCEGTSDIVNMKHIHAFGFGGDPHWEQISPFLMIVVGMGLVFAIYPGIAPGMIVPFYLVDKIEMVLLIATIFPPVIIAILRKYQPEYSPQYFDGGSGRFKKWSQYTAGQFYLFLDILMVIKISLAAIFIYSLHYRNSNISLAIINQPKMSTFLSILFYMCHEILLALGFSGFIGNNGGDLILIPQYIGALFMIFLAFYSEGYIIEYKSHDPAHWPTTGMTKWNAFCFWCKRASKITNHNLRSLFTTDLRRDLLFLFLFTTL